MINSPIANFNVVQTLSQAGGMGAVYLVNSRADLNAETFVLKTCKLAGEEVLRRFRREVRVLLKFQGNSKIVRVVAHDLDADPPAFVMKYYQEGDLTTLQSEVSSNLAAQEYWFFKMIECVSELHQNGVIHRDIKPQNFLRDGNTCVISDLGLCVEHESSTIFTRQSQSWGTEGYAPPEFAEAGGFMNATAQSDVYMLGKSFYALATGKDPRFLAESGLPAPLFYIIKKCCEHAPELRFKSLASLQQSLKSAYDVMLNRCDGYGIAQQSLAVINDRLARENMFAPDQVAALIDTLAALRDGERDQIVRSMPTPTFAVLGIEHNLESLRKFLPLYRAMLERLVFPDYSYAEVVADRMKEVFLRCKDPHLCVEALKIAVRQASNLNRYAAMETCKTLVADVDQPDLAFLIAEMIREEPDSFLASIEPWRCKHAAIRDSIQHVKSHQG